MLHRPDSDREALTRAIELARQDPAWRQQIDDMIRERGWQEAAETAAYRCQDKALHLKPWMTPPCWLRDAADVFGALATPPPDLGGLRLAAELVEKLLAAGLSRFEPDPLGALTRAARA